MKITEVEHGLTLNAPAPGYVRTPGLHMSEIYNSLFSDLEPARFKKDGKFNQAMMEIGLTFEEALAERILGARPGEFASTPEGVIVPIGTPNSIIFSADHFFYDEDHAFVSNGVAFGGEFKATKMSISKGIDHKKFDKWYVQMKAYGKPLQMRYWRLMVLFVLGDWSWKPPHGDTELRAWDIEFTQKELNDNWAVLMRHARKKGMIE